MHEAIFHGLNEQQRPAVEAVRGPVCILAGAGSGKTTTITRRIAYQVASETFSAPEILAVTFTDKAAKEMAARLQVLGVSRVRARTFHSEARAQYHGLTKDDAELLASKVPILKSLVRALPMPYRFTAIRDIATEIEWAKNQMISTREYGGRLGDHQPPIPPDLMSSVFDRYEKRKARAGMLDFEDLLARTLEVLTDPAAAEKVRSRYLAFTVDEYQDVNLLQQSLLNAWVGDRRDVCVVGDDYQSIYGFTGATGRYLLEFSRRYPEAPTIQLTLNYRSTPSILETSNALVPRLRGSSKVLRPTRADGEAPVFRGFATGGEEIDWIVARADELHSSGVPWEEIAVLYRINARSEAFEEALSRAGFPYQVADSPFLRRPGPRSVVQRLRRSSRTDVAAAVEETAKALGYEEDGGEAEGDEATRQADLGRLVLMAKEFPSGGTVADFVADLVARFTEEEDGRGIQLLTYHRAKGKEYEAMFLPRLEEGELPFALARSEERVAEERRLLYVGMTRAKQFLSLTWASSREGEKRSRPNPSPFLAEMGKGAL
ncbi:MAG: ATP-dependent helicase, partial [Actinomycetota bacterium]